MDNKRYQTIEHELAEWVLTHSQAILSSLKSSREYAIQSNVSKVSPYERALESFPLKKELPTAR